MFASNHPSLPISVFAERVFERRERMSCLQLVLVSLFNEHLILDCLLFFCTLSMIFATGTGAVWARQLRMHKGHSNSTAPPPAFRMPKRKLSDLPEHLIAQAHVSRVDSTSRSERLARGRRS